MANWDDGTSWDSGARWAAPAPILKKKTMAKITNNTTGLNPLEKCEKGQVIITKSTNNPQAPGNAVQLASFVSTQDGLVNANAAVETARDTLKELVSARDAAEVVWDAELVALAGVTQAVTGGDATAILSTGFGVRGSNTPPQPLVAPGDVMAKTNGAPGNTKLSWKKLHDAVTYLVQRSAEPMTEGSWLTVATPTRASCEVDGAVPGKVCWFRVAGVNAAGTGPWSAPACREVM